VAAKIGKNFSCTNRGINLVTTLISGGLIFSFNGRIQHNNTMVKNIITCLNLLQSEIFCNLFART
jgi:hypothetical protein